MTTQMRMLMALLVGIIAISGTTAQIPGGQLQRGVLKRHNDFRSKYQARALTWSGTLAKSAQSWVQNCDFNHDIATLQSKGYGENLSLGTETWKGAIQLWTDEAKYYDYSNGGSFNEKTGHFSQVVWGATRQVGCAAKRCPNGKLWACRYYPAGNYQGQFSKNVKRRG